MSTIQELSKEIMQIAKAKGWVTDKGQCNVAERIALIHSEVSESYGAFRNKNMNV